MLVNEQTDDINVDDVKNDRQCKQRRYGDGWTWYVWWLMVMV